MKKNNLIEAIWFDLAREGIRDGWEREYRFAPPRRWAFDLYHPGYRLAVEVQGGTYAGGAHSHGPALTFEYEKLNQAAAMGIRVVFLDGIMIREPKAHRGPARTSVEVRRRELEGTAVAMIKAAMRS